MKNGQLLKLAIKNICSDLMWFFNVVNLSKNLIIIVCMHMKKNMSNGHYAHNFYKVLRKAWETSDLIKQ